MSHANESEYQKLADDFIEQFKGDFPDVVQDLGEAGLKDRLLVLAKYKMPDKERAILVAQEPVLKIITSNSTTDANRQKAINDYTNQLDASIAQTDKLLEGIEQKSNPTKSERRQHVDALFEMHMIMALQEKVESVAENMRDPETARVMANTQAESRKLARDIKRQSMNLAKEAQSSNDPAVINRLSDNLTTMERRLDGMNLRQRQVLAGHVADSDEKVNQLSTNASANPAEIKEAKVENAFYRNNQAYFRFSRDGISESLQNARRMIGEALANATKQVTAATQAITSPKEKRKNIVQIIQEKKAKRASERQSKRASENASTATNPFDLLNKNEGRASLKTGAGEDWKVVDTKSAEQPIDASHASDSSNDDDVAKSDPYYVQQPAYEEIDESNDDAQLIDEKDLDNPDIAEKLSQIPQAKNEKYKFEPRSAASSTPSSRQQSTTLASESSPSSRRNSASDEQKQSTTNAATGEAKASTSQQSTASTRQSTSSFPTGRNPKPSPQLMEALAKAKADEAKTSVQAEESTYKK